MLEDPFDLNFNELIEVRVSSINGEGQSLPSEVNTDGVRVRNKPGQVNQPTEGPLTSHNEIEVVWDALVSTLATGNSDILAYQLTWDNNSGNTDIILVEADILSYLV